MIACEGSADDEGSGGTERFGPQSPQQLQRIMRQAADRSVLLHGLCAATIALATARIVTAAAFNALVACMVGVCVLPPVLRTLSSCGLFRLGGPCGRRSAKASAIDDDDDDDGCPCRDGGDRSVPQRRPLATPSSGVDALSLVCRRGLRLVMRAVRGVRRSAVVRPKRFRRSARRCRDTGSRDTTVTASNTGHEDRRDGDEFSGR
ncbi:hypothetical protein ACI65C_009081 [Semiaphis heraclei]